MAQRMDAQVLMVLTFDHLPKDATLLAGGKGASLARMAGAGLPVPPGFVVTSSAFAAFLEAGDGAARITTLMQGLDVHDAAALEAAGQGLRDLILSQPLPPVVDAAVRSAYARLGERRRVAVRSSAVAEDSETASFAGQQETFLNVRGADEVLQCLRECWASFFAPRALFYRAEKGALSDTRMAVVVQEMVVADKSGVMFTVDPVSNDAGRLVIEAVFGLGEGIVSGMITPHHYVVGRSDGALLAEFAPVQPLAIMCDSEGDGTQEVSLDAIQAGSRVLSDEELGELRTMGLRLEACFGRPQDVEWCIRSGELLLLQSRPITTR
jgi:phosphoenolpyruvate synthase/pyruvate phosphate dikinase